MPGGLDAGCLLQFEALPTRLAISARLGTQLVIGRPEHGQAKRLGRRPEVVGHESVHTLPPPPLLAPSTEFCATLYILDCTFFAALSLLRPPPDSFRFSAIAKVG